MSSTKMIKSLRKENSNLRSVNAKIIERRKQMKVEINRGYEEAMDGYRRERMERMIERIEREVEQGLRKGKELEDKRFEELNAGFQKEEESLRETPVPEVIEKEVGVGLEQMVSQAVEGSKRRRVEGTFDPEKGQEKMLPMMVKVGGVLWEDGIGGVLTELQETSVVVGEESRWLVGKEERDCREANGSSSSMVLLKVLGEESVHDLCRYSLCVGGRWCSVKRFVVVPSRVIEEGFSRRFGAIEKAVEEMKKGVGRLLRARNEAAKWIAYGEALKACDD
ncbi:hypothetical protein HOY80DRAFT_1006322 [Tuber brumale]|nr:hypothetical protein HOY80DRAFT_1006322 [Tuber brumale]